MLSPMHKLTPLLLALIMLPSMSAVEHATYNSAGALTSLISDGAQIPVQGEFVVSFEGGLSVTLQPHDQRSPITREGSALQWRGLSTFPNGGQAQFEAAWAEANDGVTLTGSAISGGPTIPGAPVRRWPLSVQSVDYVLDLPRDIFVGGSISAPATTLPSSRPADPVFYRATTATMNFSDAAQNWKLALTLDHPRPVSVTDRWDAAGRSYRVRIQLGTGPWAAGEAWKLGLSLSLSGQAHAAAAHLTVDPTAKRYAFDGFGGNYCFNTQTPAVDYIMEQLRQAWARFELKAFYWDREHAAPGPELVRDFELMQRVQKKGLPWIISLWRIPERFYADPNQKPAGTFNRQIAAERWPEFLDLIGSYLVYLKKNYGAEPDYYSFNEPDLGVDIGFTGETHRAMIKRIGAHLASLGLKTKMLLGDAANPRDSHKYVLPTAADPEAMKYVGAVSFHSWGGGSPQQYGAWGDVGAWLGLPLLVGEAGTDPGSWRNKTFDSYAYGLGEMKQFQELLRDSRPTAIIYWQFTEDYGLVHVGANNTIEPTGRFWLMKHFTNLSPYKSNVLATSSDQPDVLVSAFARDDEIAVHVLNLGAARTATFSGLPAGPWRSVVTTETENFKETPTTPGPEGTLTLPARSLTTLFRGTTFSQTSPATRRNNSLTSP